MWLRRPENSDPCLCVDNAPQLFAVYQQYGGLIAPFVKYIAPFRAAFLHWQSLFYRFVYPALYPVYQLVSYLVRRSVNGALSSSPYISSASSLNLDYLISVLSLVIILWLSLRTLNFIRRQVMWWVSLVTTVITWGAMLGIGVYVYNRGVEESFEDAAWVLGLLMGWTQEGTRKGDRIASEREWDAERFRRAGGGGKYAGSGAGAYQRPMGRGW